MHYEADHIATHVAHQIKAFFNTEISISIYMQDTIERMEECMKYSIQKPLRNEHYVFSVFHSSLYAIFLYHLSKVMLEKDGDGRNAEKVYYLNKVLHSVDWSYEIELPSIFDVEHPLGSIMGRAKYSCGFFFYQGCTVGGSNGNYPILGKNVIMYSDSKVLGKTTIGNDVILSANAYVIDTVIPDCSIVFGSGKNLTVIQKTREEMRAKMRDIWTDAYLENGF